MEERRGRSTDLYNRVLELRGEGLSHREIQRRIAEEFGASLSSSITSHWIRRCKP